MIFFKKIVHNRKKIPNMTMIMKKKMKKKKMQIE
jgi:hypothetical protein